MSPAGLSLRQRATAAVLSTGEPDPLLAAAKAALAGLPSGSIRAARLATTRMHVLPADDQPPPPPPWHVGEGDTWQIDLRLLPSQQPTGRTLRLGLVDVGATSAGERALVNLMYAGWLGVTGSPAACGDFLRSVALELAVSPWTQALPVVLAGGLADLPAVVGHGRFRYTPTATIPADQALPPDGPAPVMVLMGPATDDQVQVLRRHVAAERLAVVGGLHGRWQVDTDTAILLPVRWALRPASLSASRYAQDLEALLGR